METNSNLIFSILSIFLIFSSSTIFCQARTITSDTTAGPGIAAGIIERITKQQILANLPPSAHETIPTEPLSHLFLASPSGKYKAYILRHVTMAGAGGFGNDFYYLQIRVGDHSIWESECTLISNANTCNLVFSDAGLEIFDGSHSMWDTNADGEKLETLELLDRGTCRLANMRGTLRGVRPTIVNQECGSVGSPRLNPVHPLFAAPIPGTNVIFGQLPVGADETHNYGLVPLELPSVSEGDQGHSIENQVEAPLEAHEEPSLGFKQQQQLEEESPSGIKSESSYGLSNQQPLVDKTPFDSGAQKATPSNYIGVTLASALVSLVMLSGFASISAKRLHSSLSSIFYSIFCCFQSVRIL